VVNEIYMSAEKLASFATTNSVDIIIWDSPAQLASNAASAYVSNKVVNVCGASAECPALIPNSVVADQRNAAEQVLTAIAAR
jgi:hypothetical protein